MTQSGLGGDKDVDRLTEAQKESLRLVMAGFKSKEIAHRLGIGIDAVNKRLAGAKSTLGSPSRFHAARRLAAHEGPADYQLPVGVLSAVAGKASEAEYCGGGHLSERGGDQVSRWEAPEPGDAGRGGQGTSSASVAGVGLGRLVCVFAAAAAAGATLRVFV